MCVCVCVSGNPVGFVPGNILTPMDAFEVFDEDESGFLDEDEFFHALEYLGFQLSEAMQENLFKQVDFNGSQTVDYIEFREIFLHLCNVKRELEDRGIEVPSMTLRYGSNYLLQLSRLTRQ